MIPMIPFPFGGDEEAHQAAQDERKANTRKVWIHNPLRRQLMYNEKYEKLQEKYEKEASEYEALTKEIAEGKIVQPDDYEENKIFPSKEEIRAEVLAELENLEVPHSERVKTCIEADPAKLAKLVQYLGEQEEAELFLPPRIVGARDEEEAKKEFASSMKPAKVQNMDKFLQDEFQTESEESDSESESDDDDAPKKKKGKKRKKKDKKKRRSSTSTESLNLSATKKIKETKESKTKKDKKDKKVLPKTDHRYPTGSRRNASKN